MTEIPMRTKGAWNKDTILGMIEHGEYPMSRHRIHRVKYLVTGPRA